MEFEIKGNTYQIRKLSVFDQFKVSRKLLPVLSGMLSEFQQIKSLAAQKDSIGIMERVLPKIAQSLSDLSDDDANAIIYPACLWHSVSRPKVGLQCFRVACWLLMIWTCPPCSKSSVAWWATRWEIFCKNSLRPRHRSRRRRSPQFIA